MGAGAEDVAYQAIWQIRQMGKRPPADALGERWPFDQFHDQRTSSVRFFEAVNRSNVGMIERCQDSRLTLEAGHAFRVAGKHFGQHF
jgi:hypothetical protein